MKIINWIKENSILLILLSIAFVFRIYHLDFQSPWADEIFTIINSGSEKSFGEIFNILKVDVHPPLYYYIIHVFFEFLGDSIFIARFVSVIFGIAGLLALYHLIIELLHKKEIGLIAVSLLLCNYFLIYYAQEARMYTMLFFTTIMSFLFLVKFIKKPTIKTSVLYAVFASLMIYTHFFALFTLLAQCLILLYFVIKPHQTTSTKKLLLSIVSGIIIGLLFYPCLGIFLSTGEQSSFWILPPDEKVFTSMIKDFFGFSEIATFIILLTLIYYFIKLFGKKEFQKNQINPIKDKEIFTFFILSTWFIFTFFIPFLLSYIKLPMIVNRYFINIIPPLIIGSAIGVYYIKSTSIKIIIIAVFSIFSATDLIFVKDYYNKIKKTQIREASQFLTTHKKKDEKVFSTYGFLFSFYLDKDKSGKYSVTNGSINNYMNRILQGEEAPESFWNIDYKEPQEIISEASQKVLDSLFIVVQQNTFHGTFVKHYQTKKTYQPTFNISKFKPYKEKNYGYKANFNIETFLDSKRNISISGWAYFQNQATQTTQTYLALINEKNSYLIETNRIERVDVTNYFKSQHSLSASGFTLDINKKVYENGNYKLALYLFDKNTQKEAFLITDKTIEIATKTNTFSVEVDSYLSKKDAFALYFTEDNTIAFTSEKAVWVEVKKDHCRSNLYFELPEKIIPTNIRLDFGINNKQDSVVVKKIKFNYKQNNFEIKGSEFFSYFNQDSQFKTKIDSINKTLTIYKNGDVYKTPYFYPTQLGNDKVKEITIK